jgi:hypothetical protein
LLVLGGQQRLCRRLKGVHIRPASTKRMCKTIQLTGISMFVITSTIITKHASKTLRNRCINLRR